MERNIESNTGKSARQGNLTRGCRRFPCLALFAGVWFYFSLLSAVFSFMLCTFSRWSCKQCELFPLHVNQKSSSAFLCIAWRICVFIKDWKLTYGELFILKRKSMENWGSSWHKPYSMHLPVKRTWFFCLALVPDKKISHR